MACALFFDPNKKTHTMSISLLVIGACKQYKGDIQQISETIQQGLAKYKYDGEQSLRLTRWISDDEEQSAASLRSLFSFIRQKLEQQGLKMADILSIQRGIMSALNVIDEAQESYGTPDSDATTQGELKDENRAKLDEHMVEFYGNRAFELSQAVYQDFADIVTSIAYYNPNTGETAIGTNEALSAAIASQKAQMFQTIVRYLQNHEASRDDARVKNLSDQLYAHDGTLDYLNYSSAINLFYSLVAKDPNFHGNLLAQYSPKSISNNRRQKTEIYQNLVKTLRGANGLKAFQEYYDQTPMKFRNALETQLYASGLYSKNFLKLIDIIETAEKTANEAEAQVIANAKADIAKIQQLDATLLEAAKAYTMLTQFDNLLQSTYDKQIQITRGLQGLETNRTVLKYSYKQDTSHERKGWQTSEEVGSEVHTADSTKTILNSIRVFDYKTNRFIGQRVTPTSFITAFYNLIDSIRQGTLTFNTTSSQVVANYATTELPKAIKTFYADPVAACSKILKMLFESPPKTRSESLIEFMDQKGQLTDLDLSILKSVYDQLFDSEMPQSVYNKAKSSSGQKGNRIALQIITDIASYTARNVPIIYMETTCDFETGKVVTRGKKKMFTGQQWFNHELEINAETQSKSPSDRRTLQDSSKFHYQTDPQTNATNYSITLGDHTITLAVKNSVNMQLFSKTRTKANSKATMEFLDTKYNGTERSIFDVLNSINLYEFEQKLRVAEDEERSMESIRDNLNPEEQLFFDVLNFLDQTLDLGMLSTLGIQTLRTYKQLAERGVDGFTDWLQPFLKLGIRAAYINSHMLELDKLNEPGLPPVTLKQYLTDIKDPLYEYFKINPKAKIFSQRANKLQYIVASRADEVLDLWSQAEKILAGDGSKATLKDKQGNSRPNNSVSKLGTQLDYYLDKQQNDPDSSAKALFFVKHQDSIKRVFHDLEVTSIDNVTKQIKELGVGELFFHGIFNKFWGNWLRDRKSVIIQPTTYSDKTTFLNWEVSTILSGEEALDLMTIGEEDEKSKKKKKGDTKEEEQAVKPKTYLETIARLYQTYIGAAYQATWEITENKMLRIAQEWGRQQGRLDITSENYREILHLMTEEDLTKTAWELSKRYPDEDFDVTEYKDYILVKNSEGKTVVGINGSLEFCKNLYGDTTKIIERLKKERYEFLHQLLDNNCAYQVLEGNDTKDLYTRTEISTKARSRNPVLSTILEYFRGKPGARIDFFNNWVDEETGRLILAKQGELDIISISDDVDRDGDIVLNPFLEKFFFVEGFMSNNLRLSLTGSETAHKFLPGSVWDKLKKKGLTAENWSDFFKTKPLSQDKINKINQVINESLTIDDLYFKLNSGKIDEDIKDTIDDICEQTLHHMLTTSQGTQFKRNVIIPATLQQCTLGHIEGIASEINCAVIKDTKAKVYNYRGGRTDMDIDACDGMGFITPMQCILENRSLGSQAVGFTKKPIWHAYDSKNMTAFLAKLATNTLTNESMRTTLTSTTSHFRLFKKMTNLQWQGNVDLLKSLYRSKAFKSETPEQQQVIKDWFNENILRGNKLFYKNAYGEVTEILSMGRDAVKIAIGGSLDVYYTLERPANSSDEKGIKVYHLFYNQVNQDGITLTSQHLTANTAEELAAKYQELTTQGATDIHTTNSLFELHTMMGSIDSCDKKGIENEFSNEVVTNFMCEVGERTSLDNPNAKEKTYKVLDDQAHYSQPLKQYQIGYLLNNSAVKNGAKNINPASAWSDDSELAYFKVHAAGLGMQMNADHDIINSELTEFSQVITATSAYGYTIDRCSTLFKSLASTAIKSSKSLIDATDKLIETLGTENNEKRQQAISDLYHAVGRIILASQSIKDRESLTKIIFQAVNEVFYKNSDHNNDSVKIPFSAPDVYSEFVAGLAAYINRNSIKRKHSGTGAVIVAAYNSMQYYEVPTKDGKLQKLFAPTILNKARAEHKQKLRDKWMLQQAFNLADIDMSQVRVEVTKKPWKDKPWKSNIALRFYLAEDLEGKLGYFELVKDEESGFYSVHFKTGDADNKTKMYGSTKEQRERLYQAIYAALPAGAKVSTWGKVSPGGVIGLTNLATREGRTFTQLEKPRDVQDRDGNAFQIPIYQKEGEFVPMKMAPMSLALLERGLAELPEIHTGIKLSSHFVSPYNFSGSDNSTIKTRIIQQFLTQREVDLPKHYDRGYFLPADNVDIYLQNGAFWKTISLNEELDHYYKFIDGEVDGEKIPDGAYYKISTRVPANLKPSTIRWQYVGEDGETHYSNIFLTAELRYAYENDKSEDKATRVLIQDALHRIDENGQFQLAVKENGVVQQPKSKEDAQYISITEGTLENKAAELVMGNIYKEKFGIKNESLAEIKERGEAYFREKLDTSRLPIGDYDIAFIASNGKAALIHLGDTDLSVGDRTMNEDPFKHIGTNHKNEIVALTSSGQELFTIGRWVPLQGAVQNEKGEIICNNPNIDTTKKDNFRIIDGKVYYKYMYITRYQQSTPQTVDGVITYTTNTVYQVASTETILKALQAIDPSAKPKDATKQQGSLINDLYEVGDYKYLQINPIKTFPEESSGSTTYKQLAAALEWMKNNQNMEEGLREVIKKQKSVKEKQSKKASKEEIEEAAKEFDKVKQRYLRTIAHKTYISFLDSTKFISARIPAQTLQSFMAMELVGWTENSKNMAYVSHFQTYLQGSDYDIDKAYIMGQNYNDSGIYVGWSPFFNYNSLATLEASKTLPVPSNKSIEIVSDASKSRINSSNTIRSLFKIANIVTIGDKKILSTKGGTGYNMKNYEAGTKSFGKMIKVEAAPEADQIKFIHLLSQLLEEADQNNNTLVFNVTSPIIGEEGITPEHKQALLDILKDTLEYHTKYKVAEATANEAFKNIASANIYAVSHDIKNRDQAYTAIAINQMRRVAQKSPKGQAAATLNVLNPLTKYIMQYQNLVGKNVISISANGEKFWFNFFYYWTKRLQTGDTDAIRHLQFEQVFTRIKGRGTKEALEQLAEEHSVKYIPDLDTRQEVIKQYLLDMFGATKEELDNYDHYVYVDQTISQLLSAATDNAKELILAKINAGSNYAKNYLSLVMLGFNLDDIAAFMYSPTAEFIDAQSASNMFQPGLPSGSKVAVAAALGKVRSKNFLHGTVEEQVDNYGNTESKAKLTTVKRDFKNALEREIAVKEAIIDILPKLGITTDTNKADFYQKDISLDQLMQAAIMVSVQQPNLLPTLREFFVSIDPEVLTYVRYCQDIITRLRHVKSKYVLPKGVALENISTEDWQFDQMVADALEFQKIENLASEVTSVAQAWLGLNQGVPSDELGILKRISQMESTISTREAVVGITSALVKSAVDPSPEGAINDEAWTQLQNAIIQNNPTVIKTEEDKARVKEILRQAIDERYDIVGNFDVTRMMSDSEYRRRAINYVDLIKGVVNVIDMMYSLPHYEAILKLFNAQVLANESLSAKSRHLRQLAKTSDLKLNEADLRGALKHIDGHIIQDFIEKSDQIKSVEIPAKAQPSEGSIKGYDRLLDEVNITAFDLKTVRGVIGFKKYVEGEFLTYLKAAYPKNTLTKHLKKKIVDGRIVLATEIDLLRPRVSEISSQFYDEIIRGMAYFETVQFNNDYTVADIFQLYNLIMNRNQYGSDRLTTAFQANNSPTSVLQKYLNYVSALDYSQADLESEKIDFQISAAPKVSPAMERLHSEPFIKVTDPVWEYVIKRYNPDTNQYSVYPLPLEFVGKGSEEDQDRRMETFRMNYPFETPQRMYNNKLAESLAFQQELYDNIETRPGVEQAVQDVLTDLIKTGKIILTKLC